ncbi:MAG: hypothetical protein JNM63_13215, partial [Spirochaetia bacterium]|nr:hypothetical protein [Spirochaetia bacterium]
MGWRGTVRLIGSVVRQAEIANRREARYRERVAKLQSKLEEIERAKLEFEEYEEYINNLISIHKECGEGIAWDELAAAIEPVTPNRKPEQEQKAIEKFEKYKPNFIDRIFKLEEKKRQKLKNKIPEAKLKDDAHFDAELKKFKDAHLSWDESTKLAKSILSGDLNSYQDVFDEAKPFEEFEKFSCTATVTFPTKDHILVDILAEDEKVVPKVAKSLLRSGKLSVKEMPKPKFYDLYQDYVCGVALRAAREAFA